MSEEQLKTTKSYWSCNINTDNYSLETSTDLMNNILTIEESKSEQYSQIDSLDDIDLKKEGEAISLVSIEGQIYAFKNDKFQNVDETDFLNYNNSDNALSISNEENANETTFNEFSENLHDQEKCYENFTNQIKHVSCVNEENEINEHDFVEVVTTFKCKICPFASQDKSELLSHLQNIHVNPNKELKEATIVDDTNKVKLIYMCGECSICFSTIEECKKHMIDDHELIDRSGKRQSTESNSSLESRELLTDDNVGSVESGSETKLLKSQKMKNVQQKNVDVKERKVKCTYRGCLYKFSNSEKMQQHAICHDDIQNVNRFKCNFCRQLKFPKWKQCSLHLWKLHQIDIDLLSCKICNSYKSTTMVKMITHMKVHNLNKDYECPDCGKCFKQSSQLRNHRVIHLDRKTAEIPRWYTSKICELCGKTYADSKCLKNHIQAVHSKLRPYVCTVCGHSSARKSMLQMHLRQHTGDKPFNCELCDYKTGDHNSLRRHAMRHTGVKPYKCPHCPYSAIQSNSYKNHLRSKHPLLSGVFTCELCSFETVKKESYLQHIKDHEKGFIKVSNPTKDGENVEVFPGNIAAAQLIYSCLGAFSKVGRTIEANLMSSSTSADGTSQTITIQIPSKHLEGSLPSNETTSLKTVPPIEQDDEETMHCFLKIPREEEENIDTGGITIPAEPEDNNITQMNIEK
ncbi:zinc finger protein 266-like isoform X2 [Leptopilina boulardi]|uniref:zinc finger protein 266-like isoform X2 n=1 Tax=Leptopilina boulardi TaxID=63433 RepID=UPI0021F64BC2|nr:zinc finger protein 266-like isoform X2 [Leptopilina boulardi]